MRIIARAIARGTHSSAFFNLRLRSGLSFSSSAMDVDVEGLKAKARDAIENAAGELNELSQDIWKHPELCFQEHHAHNVLTDFLEAKGFEVERKFHLDTAFRATYGGREKPHISVLCEYDALPEIGHACGHNLIAEVGVAAGLGIKAAMQAAGKEIGRLTVLGTPAEEGGNGKADLINKGAFDEMDASIMAHPSKRDLSDPIMCSMTSVLVTFHGKPSHAASFPWEGVNALDAAVMTYNNVSCMRQQMKPTWRIHGIFTKGGAKPNIIPDEAQLQYYMRAQNESDVEILKEKFTNCVQAAVTASGCKADMDWDVKPYKSLLSNKTILSLYENNCTSQGVVFPDSAYPRQGGSTDMGNVSHFLPAIHPKFGIGTDAPGHTREFCRAAGLIDAQPNTLRTAKALAMTAIELFCKPDLLEQAKADFASDVQNKVS